MGRGASGRRRAKAKSFGRAPADQELPGATRSYKELGLAAAWRRLRRQGGFRSDGPSPLGLSTVQGVPTIYYRPERCSLRGSRHRLLPCLLPCLLHRVVVYTALLHPHRTCRALPSAPSSTPARPHHRRHLHHHCQTQHYCTALPHVRRRRPVAARRLTAEPAPDHRPPDRPDAIPSPSTKADAPAHPRPHIACLPAATAPRTNMPLHAARPIVRVEHSSMHTIETRNAENLFGLWTGTCAPRFAALFRSALLPSDADPPLQSSNSAPPQWRTASATKTW